MTLGICLNCGKPLKGRQKYFCCDECGRHYDKHKTLEETESRYYRTGIPIREFICANPDCGKHVYVRDPRDKRTRFCCGGCREKYFKHPQKKKRGAHWINALGRHTTKIHKEIYYDKRCAWCGKPFETKYKDKKYCSKKCRWRAKRNAQLSREKERNLGNGDIEI